MEQFERSEPTETMLNIKEYFYLFWSSALVIVLAGILVGAAAFLFSIRSTPIFEATTTLLVSAPSAINGVDPSSLVTSQTMTSTYSQMLLQRPILQGVIDQLKLKTSPDSLKGSISVDVVPNTDLLVVTVDNPDPQKASDVANAIATVFTARISELQSERYSATGGGLAKQLSDMEHQITTTSGQIAVIQQRLGTAATQTAATATQTAKTGLVDATSGQPSNPVPNAADTAALEQLQAQLTQYRTIYSNLVTTSEQVRLSEDQTSTNVVIAEPASVPSIPVRPRTLLNTLLGFVVGMLLAGSVVFAVDRLDDTVKNPDEIRKIFDLPILGMIASHEAPEDKPITLAQPRSPTAEAFRALRTNLMFAAVDKPLRRIMVTSPNPQDGKTTISVNLALVLSQGDKKVVLVDADLRRPQVHRKFGLVNRVGLSDLFVQLGESLSRVIQYDSVSGLGILTSGPLPPNPAELLSSHKMSEILDLVSRKCDLILVDAPPLLPVTDAAALASEMDGVIMVIKPGVTKISALQQAMEQLRAVNARLLGMVLNEVQPGSRKYGYHYNSYYSDYSNYDEKEDPRKRRKVEKAQTD